jgi:hypothetical protein
MVIFMAATLMIFAVMGSLSIRTQGQREKEEELAWRGEQYVRAIRLFYKKNGRFPKTMDELTAYHTDQPRFIRQAYKDPMNPSDGSWRIIYVLPNGQLSGTTIHKQLAGSMPISGPLGGTPAGTTGGSAPAGPTAGIGQQPPSGTGTQPQATPGQTPAQSASDSQSSDSPVFGGSMIGVASKMKTRSLRFYKDGKTYYEWEFFWDPTSVTGGAPGTPGGVTPLSNPPANPGQSTNPGRGGSGQ